MALYTLFSNFHNYAAICFNERQITRLCGDKPNTRFDFFSTPKKYSKIITETLDAHFSDNCDSSTGRDIPDIQEFRGRIFLSLKAFEVLYPIIQHDGECIPITYEYGSAYVFNPLSTAEKVDGLNKLLSIKNEWGDIEHIGFHEDRVNNYAIFKTQFDGYSSIYCRDDVIEAIRRAGLKGVSSTSNLSIRYIDLEESQGAVH